jgi:iron complex outermembrane receptor protein
MRKAFAAICMFLLVLSPKAILAGEDETGQAPMISMDPIVVTATRQEKTESSVPVDITVISSADIRQSTATNVPDLLRTLPGVQVKDTTGNQRTFVVDLRGFGETAQSNTLVLVDGRRINQADLSGTDWTLIPLNRIDRIEVIRGGGGSVLYGDNATGGVINIITKKGKQTAFEGDIRVGSDNLFETSAGASGSEKNLSYSVSGNYSSSDGYRDNSNSIAKNLGANLDYYFGDAASINLSAGYHKDDTGLPGALKQSDLDAGLKRTDSLNPKDYADTEDTYVSVGPQIYFWDDSLFRVDISYRNRAAASYSTFTGGSFEGDSTIQTTAISPRAIIRTPLLGRKNNLLAGFDFSDSTEDITNSSVFFGSPSVGKFTLEKKSYGGYAHDELHVTDQLSLLAGFRHDWVKYQFSPSSPESADMDEDLFTTGINYRFAKQSNIYANFSRSFRYPVMDELFSFFTNTINTRLLPQTSDDFEAGLRHNFTDTLFGSIHFFRIDTTDEIYLNLTNYQNENLDGTTRRDGVELSLTRVFDRIRVTGNYTYQTAEILDGQFSGKTIPGVPNQKASLDTRIDLGWGFALGLNGTYVGQRYFESDFSNNFVKQKDYTVVNARLDYTRKNYTVFLIGNNIFNESYSEYGVLGGFPMEPAYYPSPKFNFLAGVSIRF